MHSCVCVSRAEVCVVVHLAVTEALTEAGLSHSQVESALQDVKASHGAAATNSATADDSFEALTKYGTDLTAIAESADPVIGEAGHGRCLSK